MIVKETVMEKVRSRLRSGLTNFHNPNGNIRVMKDGGKYPPTAAEEFIPIYPGDIAPLREPSDVTIHHGYSFGVGVVRRLSAMPNEVAGERILTYDEVKLERLKPSMYARANEIVTLLLHSNGWTLVNEINAVVGPTGCFVVPFGLSSVDPTPEELGAEDFDILPSEESPLTYVGLLLRLEFGGAEYLKPT